MEKFEKVILAVAVTALILIAGGAFVMGKSASQQSFGNATMRLAPNERTVYSAVAATTTGTMMNVADFNLVNFTIATNNVSSTIQFACSNSDTAPVASTTASATNRWQYVSTVDLQSGSTIGGFTGIVFTNSTTIRQLQIVRSGFRWCTAIQSVWTAGSSTVSLLTGTNQ